jgi:hypothetical protein
MEGQHFVADAINKCFVMVATHKAAMYVCIDTCRPLPVFRGTAAGFADNWWLNCPNSIGKAAKGASLVDPVGKPLKDPLVPRQRWSLHLMRTA